MKKIRMLALISIIIIILAIAIILVLTVTGVFGKEPGEKPEIILNPVENKNPDYEWQISKTKGDAAALIKTDLGDILIKLGDCAAAEKFLELCNEGTFANAEFVTLAENMFIQTGVYGESFYLEQSGYLPINGAAAFVMDGEKAAPSIVIINAKELSGTSKAFVSESGFEKEKASLYEKFGGMPEYEGKIIVFGMVVSGTETVETIGKKENSGYTGGYSAAEPIKINSVEISFPNEPLE